MKVLPYGLMPIRPGQLALLLCCILGAAPCASSGAQEQAARAFNLPAGDAEKALKVFSQQSGSVMVVATVTVRGVRTNPVRGSFTAREALDLMLKGTGLIAVYDEKSGGFTVTRDSETVGADRSIPGARPRDAQKKNEPEIVRQDASRNNPLSRLARPLGGIAGTPGGEVESGGATPAERSLTAANAAAVEMSPFVVSVEKEGGYEGHNTLAGTRLNSKLEDLAASITVVTKEQLIDTAAVDINDVFLYEANTEGTGQYTDFVVDQSDRGNVLDNVQTRPQAANRVRGLTAANIARGNFASSSSIPVDTYNVEAIEISRGPNSNIFGLGQAGGTVNLIPSTPLLARARSAFTVRVDNWGGYRGTFDLNRPLRQDVVALRLQGMSEDKGFTRKPSTDRTNRLQAALAVKPFRQTTIRGRYETYHNFNQRPNSLTPRDGVTEWRASGSPTWDPVTYRAQINGSYTAEIPVGSGATDQNIVLPRGLYSDANRLARPTMFIDDGQVQLYTNQRVPLPSVTRNDAPQQANADPIRYLFSGTVIQRGGGIFGEPLLPLYGLVGINDRSIYDWQSINAVASNWGKEKADTYELELEQFFVNNGRHLLGLQLGWMKEDYDSVSRNVFGQQDGASTIVYVDVNERQLDGRPNPYFLHPFIAGFQPQTIERPERNENYRAVLAYQLDLANAAGWKRHLGRHRLAGFAEYRDIIDAPNGLRFRDKVVSDHAWITAANRDIGAADIYPRYYIGGPVNQPGPVVDYAPSRVLISPGEYSLYWYQSRLKSWTTETVKVDEVYTGQRPAERTIRTGGVSYQGFFWHDRIVPTLGFRQDTQRSRNSLGVEIDPATGFPIMAPLFSKWDIWDKQSGRTTTAGVVVKARPWLYLHYNQADNFQPAAIAYNNFGEQLPNPTGTGKDYGFTVSALGGKLVMRYNQYETLERDKRGTLAVIARRVLTFDSDGDTNPSNRHGLEEWLALEVAAWHPEWSAAQQHAEVVKRLGLPDGFLERMWALNLGDVNNARSKGREIEINYNPNRFLTVKANVTQQKAMDTDLSPNMQRYLEQRLPIWTTVTSPVDGRRWWTEGSTIDGYTSNVVAPLKLAITTQGKAKSQAREWRANAVGKYRLAGLRLQNWLKEATVGGAIRWEGKAAIGYLGGPPDADGAVRELDASRPVFDSAHTYYDLMLSYRLRLFKDRTRATLQLNVRNVFEDGRLQVVGVNPNGQPFNFRIIDPRQIIFSVSFEL